MGRFAQQGKAGIADERQQAVVPAIVTAQRLQMCAQALQHIGLAEFTFGLLQDHGVDFSVMRDSMACHDVAKASTPSRCRRCASASSSTPSRLNSSSTASA